jgi:polar amino acid transport system substrate-binding protein
MALSLVTPGRLTLGCADLDAPPLFSRADAQGHRAGFEPAAAALVAGRLGLELEWRFLAWSDFYPALEDGRADAVWCGQAITGERLARADFTRPYAVFDESVVVRADDASSQPTDLAGKRVGAIDGSTNMRLAGTFPGVELVAFPGTEDVFGDMIRALRAGAIDAFVDDDVAMVPLDDEPGLRLAFTLPTRNVWGVAVRKGNAGLVAALDAALSAVVADGSLAAAWEAWIPFLAFPLGERAP